MYIRDINYKNVCIFTDFLCRVIDSFISCFERVTGKCHQLRIGNVSMLLRQTMIAYKPYCCSQANFNSNAADGDNAAGSGDSSSKTTTTTAQSPQMSSSVTSMAVCSATLPPEPPVATTPVSATKPIVNQVGETSNGAKAGSAEQLKASNTAPTIFASVNSLLWIVALLMMARVD